MKRQRLFALFGALLLLAGGCHQTIDPSLDLPLDIPVTPAEETPAKTRGEKKEITLAYTPTDSMNPYQVTTENNLYLMPLIFEGLFTLSPSFEAAPTLCESYENNDTVWNFQLKKGILFHNGDEMTARDVAASIETARQSQLYAERCRNIASVSAKGSYALQITLRQPDCLLPSILTMPVLPRGELNAKTPAGTGRFLIEAGDGTLRLAANDRWQGGKSKIRSISLAALYGDSELAYLVGSGTMDAICFEKPFATSAPIRGTLDVATFSTADFHYLAIRETSELLKDAALRKALSAGADRNQMVQKAFSGYADFATLPIQPVLGSFGLEQKGAVSLLTEAGYTDTDGDGIVNAPSGKNVVLSLAVPADSAMKQQAATVLSQSFLTSGISLKVIPVSGDYAAAVRSGSYDLYYGETLMNGRFDLTSLVAEGGEIRNGGRTSTAVLTMQNALASAQPNQIALRRTELYRVFSEDMPLIPLCFGRGCVVTGQGVMNKVTAAAGNPYYNLEDWAN